MISRTLHHSDKHEILRLIQKELLPFTRRAFPGKRYSRRQLMQRMQARETFVSRNTGGRVIGFIMVKKQRKRLFIDMLAVDRDYHGKGLGTALMAAAENYGRQRGLGEVVLYVDDTNHHALRFYERKGYYLNGYVSEVRCYVMVKQL